MYDQPGFGYFDTVLDVDLSSGKTRSLPLDPGIKERYLGGRGMATRLFCDTIRPACDPLGPDNVIVIAVSALVGNRAPTGCRGHMVFKSPLSEGIGSSNCGGTWAPVFKSTGYDALIIRGKAPEPVYLDITPGSVTMHSARHLWGKDVPATTDELAKDAPPGKRPRVLCIGPAGERLVRFAAVMNDKNRAYGRGGPGAVWGSKNLKAIRVLGDRKTAVHNTDLFNSGLEQAKYLLKAGPATKRLLKELGTAGLVKLIDLIDMLPHHNFQDTQHRPEDIERVAGETISRTILKRAGACYGCPIACQRHTKIGGKSGEGPEYETDVMMGPNCGIYDLEAITLANYLCNELGLDTISMGGTLACAMELVQKGLLKEKDRGDLDLRFGRAAVLEEAVRLTAFREGVGDLLAEGSSRLAEETGGPEFSMTVKKMEIPAYDPRASFTQALGYMTSPTGACHLRGGYAVSLAFFGGAKEIPRFSLHQSPIAIRNMQNIGILQDCLGICRFTGFTFGIEPWSRMMSGITGLDFSTGVLEDIANRVADLERWFNMEAGLTAVDDTLPERFSCETIQVTGEDKKIPEDAILNMRADYYMLRGWDEGGKPVNRPD